MDKLLKSIRENDLASFIQAVNRLIPSQASPKATDRPVKSDSEMIQAILAHPQLAGTTRTIISGIGKFLEDRGYVSDKQHETIVAMYRQYVNPHNLRNETALNSEHATK